MPQQWEMDEDEMVRGWELSPRTPKAEAVLAELADGAITLDAAMQKWADLGVEVS